MTTSRESVRRASLRLPLIASCMVSAFGCHDSSGRERPGVGDVLWRADAGISTPLSWMGIPATAGNRVFIDVGNSVKAFDTTNGKELWSTVVRSHVAPESNDILVRNGQVLVSDQYAIVALDEESGATRWSVAPNDSLIHAYSAADSRVYYTGTRGGFIFALDIATGATLWEKSLGEADWLGSTIIGFGVSGDTLAVSGLYRTDPRTTLPQFFLLAMNRQDGRELWRYKSDTGYHMMETPPVITDEFFLISDVLQRSVLAFDRLNGTIRWRAATDPLWGGPSIQSFVHKDMVYFGAHDGSVYAVALATGAQKWRTNTGSSVDHVVVCGNHVFASNQGASILDIRTGRQIRDVVAGEQDFLTSHFAVAGDRVFASGTRAVYALSCR